MCGVHFRARLLTVPAPKVLNLNLALIPPNTVLVLGVLVASPLPEAVAFAPTTVGISRFCGKSAGALALERICCGRLSTVRRLELRSNARARALRCAHGSGHDEKQERDLMNEGEDWTSEITGDEKFDSAWMAAWKNKDRIRCPFFKRRATDLLEAALAVGRFILARHKSLLLFAPRSKGGEKITGLSPEALLEVIRSDFEEKRYYVTGKLTREVYSDVSVFVDFAPLSYDQTAHASLSCAWVQRE